jgi:hypothetical protein
MRHFAVLLMDNAVRVVYSDNAANALLAVNAFSKGVSFYDSYRSV